MLSAECLVSVLSACCHYERGRASLVLPIPAQGRLNLLRGPDVAQHLLLCFPLCNKEGVQHAS